MFTHFHPVEMLGRGVFCRFTLRIPSHIHTDMFSHFDLIEMTGVGRGYSVDLLSE
jgi:hypothetical protein